MPFSYHLFQKSTGDGNGTVMVLGEGEGEGSTTFMTTFMRARPHLLPHLRPLGANVDAELNTYLLPTYLLESNSYLGSQYHKKCNKESHGFLVKDLHSSNNMDGINSPSSRICKDGDQYMLFYIERPRIQRKLPSTIFEKHSFGQPRSHEAPKWDNRYLCRDCSDRKRLCSVPEELIEKR